MWVWAMVDFYGGASAASHKRLVGQFEKAFPQGLKPEFNSHDHVRAEARTLQLKPVPFKLNHCIEGLRLRPYCSIQL